MRKSQTIDRSIVAIFDIEGYSRKDNPDQTRVVSKFVDIIEKELAALADFSPDVFSTGDGAIVSLGRNCRLEKKAVQVFLSFVMASMSRLLSDDIVIRTAVHYSERDGVIDLTDSPFFKTGYIQTGDTINYATRILGFSDPKELMISLPTYKLFRTLEINAEHFIKNEDFLTKHGELLQTYSYKPQPAEHYYSPDSPWHPYKKYSYFPPVRPKTLEYFSKTGLGDKLKLVISHAYDSWRFLSDTMSFLSANSVMQVLCQLEYDPTDKIYILSRNDIQGFWNQREMGNYIERMKSRTTDENPYINQVRVMIYDDKRDNTRLMPNPEMFEALKNLHATRTFFTYPVDLLRGKYAELEKLKFGFTLSTKHRYAVIPVPAPNPIETGKLHPERIGELLSKYKEYDKSYGPMKAIITADDKYVSKLIAEMENLLKDRDASLLK